MTTSRIAVVTDSCASIPAQWMEDLGIHWVPYYIHRGEEVLRDLVTVHGEEFYQWLPTAEELPTTAAPGTGDYFSKFKYLVEEEDIQEIISIHMTSKGSGAFQGALDAKEMLEDRYPNTRVEVIDTQNVAMCHGWMVIEAARAIMGGKSLHKVVETVQRLIPITKMIQTADTLRYLFMGGRIGRASHLVGSLLNIKPLIGMEQGEILALGTARTRRSAYQKMVNMVVKAVGEQGKIKIAYVHAAAWSEAERIKELVESRLIVVESLIAELSPALGVHTGPGTAGICYFPV